MAVRGRGAQVLFRNRGGTLPILSFLLFQRLVDSQRCAIYKHRQLDGFHGR
jgi:hypothetical protein